MDLMRAVVESGLPTMSFEVGGKVLQPEIIAFAEAIRREALEEAADAIDTLMLDCGRADPIPPGDVVTGLAHAAMRVRALIDQKPPEKRCPHCGATDGPCSRFVGCAWKP